MTSLADRLPPDIATQIHPDWRRNETQYWASRPALITQFQDQWIAFADGVVLASGTNSIEILRLAQQSGRHPFVTCVGHESAPCRIRRATFAYDKSYPTQALPVISAELSQSPGIAGTLFDRLIPDTGADVSALPWVDCQRLNLDPADGVPNVLGGIGGSAVTLSFVIWVRLDGKEYPCHLQADFAGSDRILGRDVLNQLEVLFRGPAGEIVINP